MNVSFKDRLKNLFSNDFFVALLFLLAYLATNSYIYGFDDQHLEIPLLKHLIDPSLYKGDYYVESLAKNFSSYFYPLLARCITVPQIPAVYLVLFLIVRYFMFFYLYKLWVLLTKDRFSAACAVIMFVVLGRTEEFLYRTFSHQELGEAFMFAGIYYFYKERYMLAAAIFGLAANIHAIYNLFPMIYMLSFLLLFHPRRLRSVFTAGSLFILCCMPFLLWQIPRSIHEKVAGPAIPLSKWLPLYYETCPQNCLFNGLSWEKAMQDIPRVINSVEPYAFLLLLYVFLTIAFPLFRKDKKTHVLIVVSFVLCILSVIFSYGYPSRFVIDLNLLRTEQYIRLFLMAYMTFWAVSVARAGKIWQGFLAAVLFLLVGFGTWQPAVFSLKFHKNIPVVIALLAVFIALNFKWSEKVQSILRKSLIVIPLLFAFVSFCTFHYKYLQVKNYGTGFWQLQRAWIDMQKWVKNNTPKDAYILAPIDMEMGGFRIHSERKIVVCIRDCGIVGFDYQAAVEWKKRMNDVNEFKVMTNKPVDHAVLTAILKYRVDYIVFMNYYAPTSDNPILKKIHSNSIFSIFKVVNPS